MAAYTPLTSISIDKELYGKDMLQSVYTKSVSSN